MSAWIVWIVGVGGSYGDEYCFLFKMTTPLTPQEIVDAFVKASDALGHMKYHMPEYNNHLIREIRVRFKSLSKLLLTLDIEKERSEIRYTLFDDPEIKAIRDSIARGKEIIKYRNIELFAPTDKKLLDIELVLKELMHM